MGQGQVLSSFTGASQQGLSHKELGLISIPLPSIGVQRNVVAELDRLKAQQNEVRDNIEAQIETLIAYRKYPADMVIASGVQGTALRVALDPQPDGK